MRHMSKIVLILILSIGIFTIMPKNISLAAPEQSAGSAGETHTVTGRVVGVKPVDGASVMGTKNTKNLKDITGQVLGFLQMATGLISILVIAFTGFHYITAGTPDAKVELKNKMLPIVIGSALVFGAVSIATFIVAAIES